MFAECILIQKRKKFDHKLKYHVDIELSIWNNIIGQCRYYIITLLLILLLRYIILGKFFSEKAQAKGLRASLDKSQILFSHSHS